MTSIQMLIRHSGISARQFWLGLVGKLVVEALPLLVLVSLFAWLLDPHSLSWWTISMLAIAVVLIQWGWGRVLSKRFLVPMKLLMDFEASF